MAIPEGWDTCTIGGVLDSCTYGISSALSSEPNGIPILRMGNLLNGRLELLDLKFAPDEMVPEPLRLRLGDVLFNRTNSADHVGKVAYVDTDQVLGFASYLLRLRTRHTTDSLWLAHALGSKGMQNALKSIATQGVSQANINPSRMRELPLLLPPLPEQKKIAAILSSVDDAIAKTEAVIAQLQILKKAMMEQLLTKGMPGRHTRFKQTELGEIPEEWEVVRAGELCEVITKGATPKVVTSASPDCVPFLRVQNIGRRGEIDLSGSALFVTERTHTTELMRSQIRPGDVLMNIVGPPLGKVAVVPISIPKANINQAIALLRPARIESEYLSLCLTAEHLFAWLLKQAKRTSTQLNLTLESCREFPLPLPDQAERREIIACTVAMQLTLDAQQTELVALREVKSSLSSSLLSGEIRVAAGVA